ncbi:DUF2790 domain-containing protein [Pseudomonas gingeri]|uniref:DUF2790 domain-containing protein n=1 Tax=Pseudomonas gingeri TaxID=117681 RepID=UPI0015A4AA68|nr:DUF2790 domain-containing protein [Pseudomonas gingeri]NWA24910.1 DUF2790 domain-containing protein [Pseudomonas gingeri]NWD71741.1 DUF2790 domain-containing protein [Pseudomonas gingeri]
MKLFFLGFAALLATGSAFAGTADNASVIHDKAGFYVNLDVATVLSTTDLSDQCGVVPTRLDYLDHQGREHVLDYQDQGNCSNQN